jgi:hypothetical protein
MFSVRPCRSATIRTRLDAEAIRERMSALASEPEPEGFDRMMAHGYFLGGSVGAKDFDIDYRFNSRKNPQTYAVHGKVQETKDWRIVRLKLTAHAPWLSGLELLFLAGFIVFYIATGELPPRPAIGIFVGVTAVYAIANLLFIPEVVKGRVSGIVASQVSGSVLAGGKWVVP